MAAFAVRHGDWGLPMVLYLARMHSGMALDKIGGLTGGMGYKTVYTRMQRFKVWLETDRERQRMTEQCTKDMKNGETSPPLNHTLFHSPASRRSAQMKNGET